ncbi:MAG: DUF4968 domain-containing protein [Saprospiraceae bacterium]|nr:DUF4968 domain-containing protein [Saprospiraceae bacterium]
MDVLDNFPGSFLKVEQTDNVFRLLSTTDCILEITIVADEIARIRYAIEGIFENDFSYAIHSKHKLKATHSSFFENKDFVEIAARSFKVVVKKSDFTVSFIENSGKIINRDEKGFYWHDYDEFGGHVVHVSKVIQEGEHFYGLGDKTMHPNLRGRKLTNWAMDTYGYKRDEDPIYKAIPFYLGIHNNTGYGILFDNTFKSYFDFGSDRRNITTFKADGGEMNYYFFCGPKLEDVIQRYTLLTGTPELPPMWALGYHQSKWSYYPELKISEITKK